MGWLLTIAAWVAVVWFIGQAVVYWSSIGRSTSAVNKWLHALSGCASIFAVWLVWTKWSWAGIGLAVLVSVGTMIVTMLAGRFWLIHLLKSFPQDADVIMRDP